MSLQRWQETLVSATGDGSNLTASNSATSILPPQAKYTFPTNFFEVGRALRLKGHCRLGNIVTTPGTLTLDVRLGGTVVLNGGAMQLSTTVHTTLPFTFEALMTCRANGSSGNFIGIIEAKGQQLSISTSDSTATHSMLMAPNVTPVVGSNVDTTTALQLDVFATFSLSNANAIQLHQFILESLN